MAHYVYILGNEKGNCYTGQTSNLKVRLCEHNRGNVTATKSGIPWNFNWFCAFKNKKKAILFKKYLKSGSGRSFRKRHFFNN